jgi:hypothetical protein
LERQLLRASEDASTTGTGFADVDIPRMRRERIGRRWLVLGAAATAILLVAGTVLVTGTGDDGGRGSAAPGPASTTPTPPSTVLSSPSTIPPPPTTAITPPTTAITPPTTTPGDESTQGRLLPEGAPSTPHIGELVASIPAYDRGSYYLYTDGRLIWWSDGAGERGGWVEQRLTPEGVERVRFRFVASGLFDPAQPPSDVPCGRGVFTGDFQMCVRGDDGRLLSAPASTPEASSLFADLQTLKSSLPKSEWADPLIRPYVASRIAVCLQLIVYKPDKAVHVPPDVSILLPLLPAPAAELLDSREAIAPPIAGTPEGATCFEMTLEEARTLEGEFLSPSGGGSHQYWGIVIKINQQFDAIDPPDATEGNVAYFNFRALLPDGVSISG